MNPPTHCTYNLKWVDFHVVQNKEKYKEMQIFLHEKGRCGDDGDDDSKREEMYSAVLKWNAEKKGELKRKERKNPILRELKLKFAEIAMYFLQQNWAYILKGDMSKWQQLCQENHGEDEICLDETVEWEIQNRYNEICYQRYPKTYIKLMRVLNLDVNRGKTSHLHTGTYFSFHDFQLAFFNYLLDHKKFCDENEDCTRERALYRLLRSQDLGERDIGERMKKIFDLKQDMSRKIEKSS